MRVRVQVRVRALVRACERVVACVRVRACVCCVFLRCHFGRIRCSQVLLFC